MDELLRLQQGLGACHQLLLQYSGEGLQDCCSQNYSSGLLASPLLVPSTTVAAGKFSGSNGSCVVLLSAWLRLELSLTLLI